jgi:hypothetical protein
MRISGLISCLSIAAAALIAMPLPATSKITRLEVASKVSYGTFQPGEYVRWEGQIRGEVTPAEPIPDLDRATKNARGMVDYSARITLIMPADPRHGNGGLLIDLPNRGRPSSHTIYNSPRDLPVPIGTFDQGTGFLEDHGFSVAAVHWELGQGTDLPSFTDGAGKQRYIEGIGFAIVRDSADFLANAPADEAGTPNPLAGSIKRTIALGYSQTARLLKTMLITGFDIVEGRRVFAGMHLFGGASGQAPILQSGTGPTSSAAGAPTFTNPAFPGVTVEPLTMGDIVRRAEERGLAPPRLIVVNTTTDYFTLRASLLRTGVSAVEDQPIPGNVRMYDMAGASHAIATLPECKHPYDPLDWHPILRATLLQLDRWVSSNVEPPPSRLMPLRERREERGVLPPPASLPNAVIQVPMQDQDGNFRGGIRLPDVEAPLGVYGDQNEPLTTVLCSLNATFVAFARTQQEREARGDTRASLAERYKGRDDYINRLRVATRALENDGFLLPQDAAIIVNAAAEVPAFR